MGRSPSGAETGLKKGPWTPEEDEILVGYIQKNGHGSWRALPNLAGIPSIHNSMLGFSFFDTKFCLINWWSFFLICLIQFDFKLQVLTDVGRVVD